MPEKTNELEVYLQTRLKEKGHLFIPYLALGDPDWQTSLEVARRLIHMGADSIELGLPFTDPVADGPVLKETFKRVLTTGFSMQKVFSFLDELKKEFPEQPFLVMGYSNLFYKNGFSKMFRELYKRSVRGVIIPDLPFEEKAILISRNHLENFVDKIAWIDFVTPTTNDARLKEICSHARGFIYIVSVKGTTGQGGFSLKPIKPLFNKMKKLTSTPLMVGFGIRKKSHTHEVMQYANGYIVGTLLHSTIEENLKDPSSIPGILEKKLSSLVS